MIDYIEKLRAKPEHVRRRFAFIVSFSFSFLILTGWLASYSLKSSTVLAEKKDSIKAPVSSLTASVGSIFGDIKNIFSGSNKIEYTSDIVEMGPGSR